MRTYISAFVPKTIQKTILLPGAQPNLWEDMERNTVLLSLLLWVTVSCSGKLIIYCFLSVYCYYVTPCFFAWFFRVFEVVILLINIANNQTTYGRFTFLGFLKYWNIVEQSPYLKQLIIFFFFTSTHSTPFTLNGSSNVRGGKRVIYDLVVGAHGNLLPLVTVNPFVCFTVGVFNWSPRTPKRHGWSIFSVQHYIQITHWWALLTP